MTLPMDFKVMVDTTLDVLYNSLRVIRLFSETGKNMNLQMVTHLSFDQGKT